MQRRTNIKRGRQILLAGLLLVAGNAQAQIPGPAGEWLDKIRKGVFLTTMTYDYRVVLRNVSAGKDVDSLRGKLYARDKEYVDSNTILFTARSGNILCKLDFTAHTAALYDIQKEKDRMGYRMDDVPAVLFSVTDSVIARSGSLTIDKEGRSHYRLKIRLKDFPIAYLQADLDQQDYHLIAAVIETEERDPNDADYYYRTTHYLYNVRTTFDPAIFDLSRIYKTAGNKVLLQGPYKNYTLTHTDL